MAAGVTYTITAVKQAQGDAKHYVPRCISGSAEADLDAVNKKMLLSRFGKNMTVNRCSAGPSRRQPGPCTASAQFRHDIGCG